MRQMALELNVLNSEEFERLVTNRDFRISQALVNTVLKNLNGKKHHYHALSVHVEDEGMIYDITVDKSSFGDILKTNLKGFEIQEEYEKCALIVDAIKTLSNTPKRRGRPKKNT